MSTVGIVLAAGRSTRFGEADKLLATYKGRPLCSYAAEAMRGASVDVKLACIQAPDVGAQFAEFDSVTCAGTQSDSLKAGLQRARSIGATRVLISLADMPNVTTDLLNRVLATQAPIAACRVENGPLTVPALFDQSYFDALAGLDGDKGARALLRDTETLAEVLISPYEAKDVDRPIDLA